MNVVDRYFAAWNDHAPSEVQTVFTEGGTYADPATGGPLSGPAIAAYVGGLCASFPNLSFDIVSRLSTGTDVVAAQWVMRGTNLGPVSGGLPPTGRSIELPGADFIVVEGDRIRSVQGYFDQRAFMEQLGVRVVTLPPPMGPVAFGTSFSITTGKRTQPGAMSMTTIQLRDEAEAAKMREYGQGILTQATDMPGFISAVTGQIGLRFFTVSAWENSEAPRNLLRGGAHREAMRDFYKDYSVGGVTSVWIPERINTMWVRCASCGRMVVARKAEGACPECGQRLPDHPPYW